MKATARDLRTQTSEIFDALERGEEVVVTYRGKERAKLIPINEKMFSGQPESPLFGMWRDRKDVADVAAHVRDLRESRSQGDR